MDYRDFKESQTYTRAQIEAQAKQRALAALNGQTNMGSINTMSQQMNSYQQPTLSGLQRQAEMATKNKIDQLQKALTPKPQEKKGMFKYVKEYLEEHKAVVMPVLLVILADHFLLGGAFRERLKAVLSKLLAGAEKKIDALTGPTEAK